MIQVIFDEPFHGGLEDGSHLHSEFLDYGFEKEFMMEGY